MPLVVGVHGIGQQLKGSETLLAEWGPALRDGLRLAGKSLAPDELACAAYGHLFRPAGHLRAADEAVRPSDLTDEEAELLRLFWEEAARAEPERVVSPDAEVRAATPSSIQRALRVLARSRFFSGLSERAFLGNLRQVTRYLRDPAVRSAARAAVDEQVDERTRVIVAHSLGTVVAYEALHRYADEPRWANVNTFVTLGSPLGIPHVIFRALDPAPTDGKGAWPAGVDAWTNVSDDGDVVALEKRLAPLFGPDLVDVSVSNGSHAHDVTAYLTARETGRAIANGLP